MSVATVAVQARGRRLSARAPRRLRRAGHRIVVLSDPALGHADDLVQVDGGNPGRADPVLAEGLHAGRLAEGLVVRLHRAGLRRRSGRILELNADSRPSVISSIALGALTGYAMTFYRVRGANLLFAIMLVGAFIPYQVFIYPMVRVFSLIGLYDSLTGIVVVHVIFGLPLMTLLFRNYYSSLPIELFNAARVDGAGF